MQSTRKGYRGNSRNYDFQKAIALAWLRPEQHWPKHYKPTAQVSPVKASHPSSVYMTDKSLSAGGKLDVTRKDTSLDHLPTKAIRDKCCQLHYYIKKEQYRSRDSYR